MLKVNTKCLLEQYKEQVSGFKLELLNVFHSIVIVEDAKALPNEKSQISDAGFSIGLKISK